MDEALIKPEKVRRVLRLVPPADDARAGPDVVAQGTLVEVADPRALRPRSFRVDFVHRPGSSAEDVALCELPPLIENVLAGTDAVLLVGGSAGGAQAELLDGDGGLNVRAVSSLLAELQARQIRHRSQGSGGYSFVVKLHAFQVVGDRIEDLLVEHPAASRLSDTAGGVVVDGLQWASIAEAAEAARVLAAARGRQDAARRPRVATAVWVDVTQGDYFAGWGLFGRLLLVELPALDCLAEDRGLVQLREGFDTFRGVFHLRSLVQGWRPCQAGDVHGSSLTWLLREALCGGSCAATVLLCVRQQQPDINLAMLEFLDAFAKVVTNPVCCDHRVAGLLGALRAELLQARQQGGAAAGPGAAGHDAGEDSRRAILELERRLRAAESLRDEAIRSESQRQDRAVEVQVRFAHAFAGQEALQDRLLTTEEQHCETCESLVRAQTEHAEARGELGELRLQDEVILAQLEHEVADLQTDFADAAGVLAQLRERRAGEAASELADDARELAATRARVRDLKDSLDAATEAKISADVQMEVECANLEARAEAIAAELQLGAAAGARERDEELRAAGERAQAPLEELQALRLAVSELRDEVRLEAAAVGRARESGEEAGEEIVAMREEFQASLARMAAGPASADGLAVVEAEIEGSRGREAALRSQLVGLDAHAVELQKALAWSASCALDWAPHSGADVEKARLRAAADAAAARVGGGAASGAGRGREVEERRKASEAELDAERRRAALVRAEQARELQHRDAQRRRLEEELGGLRRGGVAAAVGEAPTGLGQQLLSGVAGLAGQGYAAAGADAKALEENRALRERIERLERGLPAEQRKQLQRLAFLERSARALEGERSELFVRATVAEEQLVQLQRHLKELTEGYQMQIVQLKTQGMSR